MRANVIVLLYSHPAPVPLELDESEDFVGIKRAAQRRLHFELGIKPHDIPVEDIHFMTRFTYVAPFEEDPVWGEHEMDYVLVINREVDLTPNPKEVKHLEYVTREQLDEMLRK